MRIQIEKNPLFFKTGAERLKQPVIIVMVLAFSVFLSIAIYLGGRVVAIGLMALPFLGYFFYLLYRKPKIGLYSILVWAFLGIGAKRYTSALIGGVKMGLAIDILIVLTLLAFFFRYFKNADWRPAWNSLTLVVFIWFGYNVLEMFNPEAIGMSAWFYSGRGVALYILGCVPLAFLLLNSEKDLELFIWIWLSLSFLGALWGLRQLFIGLDFAEKDWISDPRNLSTHMLQGKLRVFSFYTDAGQFGAAQGHAALGAFILALGPACTPKKRIIYGVIGSFCLVGLFVSGTRGALAVPFVGGLVYLVMSKNWKIIIAGIIGLVLVYGFFKYTYIGNGVYDIRRMRMAVRMGTETPSLKVRKRNQETLSVYLRDLPFGGGVGSAGYWGLRFKPDSVLANIPTDSWYVRIWAEEGVVGLWVFLGMQIWFFLVGGYYVLKIRDPNLRQMGLALYAGVWAISGASYGNQVFGQMPTGIIMYYSMPLVFMLPGFDKKKSAAKVKIKESRDV